MSTLSAASRTYDSNFIIIIEQSNIPVFTRYNTIVDSSSNAAPVQPLIFKQPGQCTILLYLHFLMVKRNCLHIIILFVLSVYNLYNVPGLLRRVGSIKYSP